MRCASTKTLTIRTQTLSFFVIMSTAIALNLLAQGNTGAEILQILDAVIVDLDVTDEEIYSTQY